MPVAPVVERPQKEGDKEDKDGTGVHGANNLRKSNKKAQGELKKLKKEMDQLKKDNEHLEQQTAQLQGTYGHRPGTGTSGGSGPGAGKRIQRAREVDQRKDLLSSLQSKLDNEQGKVDTLGSKIDTVKLKTMDVRRQMGSVNVTKESNEQIEKQIKVLENRLDKALVKFNEALHINKELREQIDNLRRERGVFDAIYKKLERELQEKKKEMAFIIEVSNIAYEERDNANNELSQLKLYAAKEMQSFEETFKELDELLEEDRKMKEAIKQRMNERKDTKADGSMKSTVDDEQKMKGRKASPTTGLQSVGATGAAAEMTAQNYEEMFATLKQATNITDINQLVDKFLHAEDDNFSLFNFVNELNNEIEKLEDARNEIKLEMERVKGTAGTQGDVGRQTVLKHLEERLNREEQNSKRFAEMADRTSKLLEHIMGCVDKLFNVLECEETKIIEQQGTAGLTENTLHLYLAAVELKSDEHLLKWRKLHGTAERGPAFPFGSTNISIDIPSTGEDYGDGYSDEEERVLTRDELLLKTNAKLAKQQQASNDTKKGGKGRGKKKATTVFS